MSEPSAVSPDPDAPGAGAEPPRPEPSTPSSTVTEAVVDEDRRRPTTMVALDPRLLRRSLIALIVALIALQVINWSWERLGGFAFNMLIAWLVAISIEPIVAWLAGKGIRRGLATTIVALVSLAGIALFIAVLGGALADQVAQMVKALPKLVLDIVDWINDTFNANIDPNKLTENLNLSSGQVTSIAGNLAGGILGAVLGVVGAVFDMVTVIVFSFYFSVDSPRIKRFVASWLPPARQVMFIRIWDISVHKAGGFVISKVALATLSAVFHCGFFYLISVPYWLPMGIFAGVVSQFIPTIGTYIGVALPALFAVFEDPIDVIWIILFATVYQQIENYVFTPRISNKTMDINSGVALASVFIGAALFGPIGAIIGIPLAAIVIAVLEAYGQRYEIHPYVERSVSQA